MQLQTLHELASGAAVRTLPARGATGAHCPFYFEANGRTLYANYRRPLARATGRAVLLCNAFGKEYEICRTPLGAFARDLQRAGHAVLAFDYGGYGDSHGEFEDATVTTMSEDISAALDALKRLSGSPEAVLLGVRFGATLAARVACGRRDLRALVLWEPIAEPWRYIHDALRQSVAQQAALFRAVKATRDEIVANVLAGRPTMADGYDLNFIDEGFPLGREALRELRAFERLEPTTPIEVPTFIAHIARRKNPEGDPPPEPPKPLAAFVALLRAQATPCVLEAWSEAGLPWVHDEHFVGRSARLFARSLEWVAA